MALLDGHALVRRAAPVLEPLRPTVRWALGHGLPSVLMRFAARRGDVQGRLIVHGVSGDRGRCTRCPRRSAPAGRCTAPSSA